MSSFYLLFDEWDCAAAAAARATARLSRHLDAYCAGMQAAPDAEQIAEARRLTDEANRRLAALRFFLHEQRGQVALL